MVLDERESTLRPVRNLAEELLALDAGGLVGLYLTGSAVRGGLRPDSDLDLLVLTRRSLTPAERRSLLACLLPRSGRSAVPPSRPVELVSLVVHDVVPWRYPADRDFLYGEWLRTDVESGWVPTREPDPDVAIILTAARETSIPLAGPPVLELTEPVPSADLRRSLGDALPALLAGLRGDERNVLLTLARIVVTLRTGRIVPKDRAARDVAGAVPEPHRSRLLLAGAAYRGETTDDWADRREEAASTAYALVDLVDRERTDGAP